MLCSQEKSATPSLPKKHKILRMLLDHPKVDNQSKLKSLGWKGMEKMTIIENDPTQCKPLLISHQEGQTRHQNQQRIHREDLIDRIHRCKWWYWVHSAHSSFYDQYNDTKVILFIHGMKIWLIKKPSDCKAHHLLVLPLHPAPHLDCLLLCCRWMCL